MGFGKKPGSPPNPGLPPPAAHPGILGMVGEAMLRAQRNRVGTPYTASDTIKTSPQGVMGTPTTAKATLLGH